MQTFGECGPVGEPVRWGGGEVGGGEVGRWEGGEVGGGKVE